MKKNIITKSDMKYGASYDKETDTVNFKLASYSAQNVILCIFKNSVGDIPFPKNKLFKKEIIFITATEFLAQIFQKLQVIKKVRMSALFQNQTMRETALTQTSLPMTLIRLNYPI